MKTVKTSLWRRWCRSLFGVRPTRPVSHARWRRNRLAMEPLEDRVTPTLTPVMIADINPGWLSSSPSQMVTIGETTYFTAYDSTHGRELWKTDGTAAGTTLVKDIYPGTHVEYYCGYWGCYSYEVVSSSSPNNLTNVNGKLFFTAYESVNGWELWTSDGTEAGTILVKDIRPGSGSSYPSNLTNVNGKLFFTAYDGVNGGELWMSDGTESGTVLVKDIHAGNSSSDPSNLTNMNGMLFFSAYDGVNGRELWKSDGTAAGTVLVKDIRSGAGSGSLPGSLTNVNGTLFFSANDGVHGPELWKSDGTAAGTVLVNDIYPGINWFGLRDLTNVNGTLFFAADYGVNGPELWKSDGTAAGTVLVKDIRPGSRGSYPSGLINVNGTLFFSTYDDVNGRELWKSDGTTAGTTLVKDIYPGSHLTGNWYYGYGYVVSSSSPGNLTNVNGTLFFVANDSEYSRKLWMSDGTEAGTLLVTNFNAGALANVNGTLFFEGYDVVHGSELWKLVEDGRPRMSLDVGGFPAAVTAGVSGQFTVTVRNADGTVNTGYTGIIHFTSSDPRAVLPADYKFTAADNGVHTFSVTLLSPGSQSITVRDTLVPMTSCTQTGITVTPAVATISGFPATVTAGVAGNFTVTIRNADGSPATGYRGTVHFTSSDLYAVLPDDYTFTAADNGVHTFSATLKTAGSQSITVSDPNVKFGSSVPGVTAGTQAGIAVAPAAASRFTVTGFPYSTTAGVARNFTVTAYDAYGNVATDYTGTVRFTSSASQAVLPADYTFTAADNGVHTFSATLKTAGWQYLTATDTGGGFTGAGQVFVKAAAASRLILTAPTSVKAGAPFSLTVTVVDAYGNVVTDFRGTLTLSSTDRAAGLPKKYTFTEADAGTHTFTGLTLKKKGKQSVTTTITVAAPQQTLTASVSIQVL